MTRPRARVTVFLSTLALALSATATPAIAASPPTLNRGQAAAGWLARQMTDGSHFTDTFDGVTYPDQGLTIDAIFAFAATGTASNYAARATTWLARPHILSNYIGNGTAESYAGATAKLLLAAEVRGVNPAAFGGVDLPARLASLLTPSGRYSDHSKYGDFSNAFSQSLAVIALSRRGGAPAAAVNFLASTECGDGGFPLYFAQTTCTSDPDATAMDVQALLAAGQRGPAERGGFISSPGAAPNTNSTGLAGEAFASGGRFLRAIFARFFLVSVQIGCSGKTAHQGALAYDSTGFHQATAAVATAQGILGLADVGLARLSAQGAHPGDPHLACTS